jgi:hypothetical protein
MAAARFLRATLKRLVRSAPRALSREVYRYICTKKDILFWTGEQILDWYLSERKRLQLG